MTTITSGTWTLIFKSGKQTILIFAEPLTPFDNITSELLFTLRERYPDNAAIPDDLEDVTLASLDDVKADPKTWTELDTSSGASPQSLGLKEGAIIAFRFAGGGRKGKGRAGEGSDEDDWGVEWSSYEEYDEENELPAP